MTSRSRFQAHAQRRVVTSVRFVERNYQIVLLVAIFQFTDMEIYEKYIITRVSANNQPRETHVHFD